MYIKRQGLNTSLSVAYDDCYWNSFESEVEVIGVGYSRRRGHPLGWWRFTENKILQNRKQPKSHLRLPSFQGVLLYSSPGTLTSVPFWIGPAVILTASSRHFSWLTYKFYGACWLRVATWRCFSGFKVREIHVSRAWCVYLATGFDFRENKILLVLAHPRCKNPWHSLVT